jgi:hypothetical protein
MRSVGTVGQPEAALLLHAPGTLAHWPGHAAFAQATKVLKFELLERILGGK